MLLCMWSHLCSPGEPHRSKNQLLGVWDRMEPKCVRRVPATSDTAAHLGTHTLGSTQKPRHQLSTYRSVELGFRTYDTKGKVEGGGKIAIKFVLFTWQSVNINTLNPHKDLTHLIFFLRDEEMEDCSGQDWYLEETFDLGAL